MSIDPERWPALHPFLFGLFPVLFFFSQNAGQLDYGDMMIPTLFAVGLTTLCLTVGRVIYGSWRKGAIVASLAVVLFFSYGHIWNLISRATVFGIKTRHDYLLPLWAGLFVTGVYMVFRTQRELRGVTGFLNVAAASMVTMSLLTLGLYEYNLHEPSEAQNSSSFEYSELDSVDSVNVEYDEAPDIYYIIPDAYASSSTLYNLYGYDNGSFLSSLEDYGFTVYRNSISNYSQTQLSVSSSMNMSYLKYMRVETNQSAINKIKKNKITRTLKEHKYEVHSFDSGLGLTRSLEDSNVHCKGWWGNTHLGSSFIRTTIFGPIFYRLNLYGRYEKKINCALKNIKNVGENSNRPKFVFVHLMSPHPPWTFDSDGSKIFPVGSISTPESLENKEHYLSELEYISGMIESVIEDIKNEDDRKKVIIIQSDHGTKANGRGHKATSAMNFPPSDTLIKARMGILNAYHLPGCSDRIYEGITPVNSFRVVFNCYFDTDLDMLPDKSYFSSYDSPFDFEDVTERARWEPVEQDSTVRETSN